MIPIYAVSIIAILALLTGFAIGAKVDKRPVMKPGQVVTFYDHSRTWPVAKMVVQEYAVSRDGRQMILVGLEETLKDRRVQ